MNHQVMTKPTSSPPDNQAAKAKAARYEVKLDESRFPKLPRKEFKCLELALAGFPETVAKKRLHIPRKTFGRYLSEARRKIGFKPGENGYDHWKFLLKCIRDKSAELFQRKREDITLVEPLTEEELKALKFKVCGYSNDVIQILLSKGNRALTRVKLDQTLSRLRKKVPGATLTNNDQALFLNSLSLGLFNFDEIKRLKKSTAKRVMSAKAQIEAKNRQEQERLAKTPKPLPSLDMSRILVAYNNHFGARKGELRAAS